MGQAPKPISQHLADGTYRQDRHGDRAYADPVGTIGDCPDDMPFEGRVLWQELSASLTSTLGQSDRSALEACCRWFAAMRDAFRDAEAESDVVARGKILRVAAAATSTYLALATKLGATPLDRQRLRRDTGDDDADDLLSLRTETA